ncbi:unnamed protein product [Fusarium equiseti]|uniref:Uncharacterized protein n=1 Tax=Fusarium equiseti TaxID=61235 RepID=A0A8J2NCB7_FUSEQ|nr:unnamed protein product [Fusarium equiseti]
MEHQAILRRVIEDETAIRRIIQELEPLLTELARAKIEYQAAKEQYSHEVDRLREGALFKELARCKRRWDDIQTEATVLLQDKLHRTIEDRAALGSIIQELEPFVTGQLAEAKAEHDNAKELFIHEADPLREEASFNELERCKGHYDDIEIQATALLQEKLRTFLLPSEQPGGDATLASASTGPDNDQSMNRPTKSRRTNHQRQVITASSPESMISDTSRSSRSSFITTSPLTKRTIRFNEVHGDGHRCWCRIIERNGHYYIFKCKEHGKLFSAKDPLKAATSHLRLHSGLKSNNKNAFKYLGYRVVDCNEARRMENQTTVDRFLEEQKYKEQRDKVSIYDLDGYPQPVLPFSDFMISDSGHSIPAHYEINEVGDYEWAEGYKDGQKCAKNRKYLIMCFDGKDRHQLVWLPAKHFRQLNLQDEHLEHRQDVEDFLVSRRNTATLDYLAMRSNVATGPGNEIEDGSDDLYDDSRNGDADDDNDGDGPASSEMRVQERSETLELVEGDRTGSATDIQGNEPQRDVKAEAPTQPSGSGQLWPMARRAPPDMMSLDNSDFSDSSDSSE